MIRSVMENKPTTTMVVCDVSFIVNVIAGVSLSTPWTHAQQRLLVGWSGNVGYRGFGFYEVSVFAGCYTMLT